MRAIKWYGFLGKHEDGTVEVWAGELTEDEQKIICEIAANHETVGSSIRGKVEDIRLAEVVL